MNVDFVVWEVLLLLFNKKKKTLWLLLMSSNIFESFNFKHFLKLLLMF